MKQKILVVFEVECDSDRFCLSTCSFLEWNVAMGNNLKSPPFTHCRLFGEELTSGEDGIQRRQRCREAAGNHNILGKCLAGE